MRVERIPDVRDMSAMTAPPAAESCSPGDLAGLAAITACCSSLFSPDGPCLLTCQSVVQCLSRTSWRGLGRNLKFSGIWDILMRTIIFAEGNENHVETLPVDQVIQNARLG
jgi:hypothetical protein